MKRRSFIASLAALPFAVHVKPKATEKPMQLIHGDSTWATMPEPEVR